MSDRDRLIELLQDIASEIDDNACKDCEGDCVRCAYENIADYILADGWIRPPCKVGQTVYVDEDACEVSPLYYDCKFIYSKHFLVGEIVSIIKTKKQVLMKIRISNSIHTRYRHQRFTVNAVGKTVFLTKEEAEQALKVREQGGC